MEKEPVASTMDKATMPAAVDSESKDEPEERQEQTVVFAAASAAASEQQLNQELTMAGQGLPDVYKEEGDKNDKHRIQTLNDILNDPDHPPISTTTINLDELNLEDDNGDDKGLDDRTSDGRMPSETTMSPMSNDHAPDSQADDKEIQKTGTDETKDLSDSASPSEADIINDSSRMQASENVTAPVDTAERSEEATSSSLTPTIAMPPMSLWIVTTAALPWRTGTSVNPLYRALSLLRHGHEVTLLLPWLSNLQHQQALFSGRAFATPQEQEAWIRNYCRQQAIQDKDHNISAWRRLGLVFYDAVYHAAVGCIFPVEDLCARIPADTDIVILEEPEHLNWFYCPNSNPPTAGGSEKPPSSLVWTQKFRHVVGILHTNYGRYLQEYTTSPRADKESSSSRPKFFQTPSVLNAYSALILRAYCHVVIALSDTLPRFVEEKQVTCNVHGVRSDFFLSSSSSAIASPPAATAAANNSSSPAPASVYFVGKLVWAKGFEYLVQAQERFQSKFGDYFEMDVYGAGKDQDEIQRAFLGRHDSNNESMGKLDSSTLNMTVKTKTADADKMAAEIFGQPTSLRSQVSKSDDAVTDSDIVEGAATSVKPAPVSSVVSDLGSSSFTTGVEAAQAAMTVVESVFLETFSSQKDNQLVDDEQLQHHKYHYVPSRATFKWRKTPIPARFLGVQDHVIVRDIPEQKIFLNMSTSEVLCTTSAEALAMGKFVILPRHPSNVFFYQFPNCLVYKDIDDCVTKLHYALFHDPEPLTEQYAFILSWEGATKRLYKAAQFSEALEKRAEEPQQDSDMAKATKIHVGLTKKSQFVSKLFGGKLLAKNGSSSEK